MKFSRRDFIHAGCVAGAASLAPHFLDRARAGINHGAAAVSAALSTRSVINLSGFAGNGYPFINHYLGGIGTTGPFNSWRTSTHTYGANIDANGWPNTAEAGGQTQSTGGQWSYPSADEFNGPYIFQWDGDGSVVFGGGSSTVWTEQNYTAPGFVSFTSGSPDITFANSVAAGRIVVFDTTVAGLTAWTKYYVSTNGLTASKIRVAASLAAALAGSFITPSANGSPGIFGAYQKFGSNGGWINTQGVQGVDARVIAVPSGSTGEQIGNCTIVNTDNYGAGSYCKNILIERQEDDADRLAGNIFRTGWKQQLVNLNPSAIRFMNWCNGGLGPCRFENRALPTTAGWCGGNNDWTISPVYGDMSGVNALTLGSATPTASNPKTTPGSDFHGEVVTCRLSSSNNSVRTGKFGVAAISNATFGQITTDAAHGFQVGDIVVHTLRTVNPTQGMYQLHFRPVVVHSVIDSLNYTISLDTSSFGSFTPDHTKDFCTQFITLSVGGRRAYQLMTQDGGQPLGWFGGINVPSTTAYTFYFDKNSAAETTGQVANFTGSISGTTLTVSGVTGTIAAGQTLGCNAGGVAGGSRVVSQIDATHWTVNISQTVPSNTMFAVGWVYGAWINSSPGGASGNTPIEICVAMVNEINAMSIAQGIAGKVGLWLNVSSYALMPGDPDYTTASDFGLGMADVVTNPSSTLRSPGYSNLLHGAPFFDELGNEIWNFGMFTCAYTERTQTLRWPGTSPDNGVDMHGYRSTLLARTIRASYPTSQIKSVLGLWGGAGCVSGGFGSNYELCNGNNTLSGGAIGNSPGYSYTTDIASSSWGAPLSNHDACAIATYFDPDDGYYDTGTGTGTFTDDSAMFNGTNNSGNGGGNYTGAANPTQANANFVSKVVNATSQGPSIYLNTILPQFTAVAKALGKTVINYEGGTDWTCVAGTKATVAGYTLTAGDAVFSQAVIQSPQWATAQINYLNGAAALAGSAMPGVYLFINASNAGSFGFRWSYSTTNDGYLGTVEGGALAANPTWSGMGTRNRALPN